MVDVVAVEIAASPHERPPTARARVGTNADKTLPSAQRIARQKVRRVRGTCGHAAHPTELDALTHELFDDRPGVAIAHATALNDQRSVRKTHESSVFCGKEADA